MSILFLKFGNYAINKNKIHITKIYQVKYSLIGIHEYPSEDFKGRNLIKENYVSRGRLLSQVGHRCAKTEIVSMRGVLYL